MQIEIDTTKEEAQRHFSTIFEGFSDGTNGWDYDDYHPAWEFLERLKEAIAYA